MHLIVSYYGNLDREVYAAHLAEIRAAGFDTVLLCVPWSHLADPHIQAVRALIAATKHAGLSCWADPWGLTGFDGEIDPDPYGDCYRAASEWIDTLGRAPDPERPDAVFLDNPHALDEPCLANPHLIAMLAARAKGYGMATQVCLSADRHWAARERIEAVARLDVVKGVWVDPYSLGRSADFLIDEYVGGWAERMAGIAAATGTPTGVWVQGHNIDTGYENLPILAADVALGRGVQGLGFWWLGWSGEEPTPGGPVYRRETRDGFMRWLSGISGKSP